MSCWHPVKRVSIGGRWSRAPYPSAGSASRTRSPTPLCFSHPMTAVTSRALSCSSTEASRKFELRVRGRPTKRGVKPKMQTNQVNVQRWSITSRKPFDTVLAAVEEAIGRPNMVEFAAKVAAATTFEEMQNVINESVSEIGLMEFMRLDHGAILAKAGVDCDPKSVRVIMGNPLIMQSMARFVPDAGSYAPVTVLVDERADGVHLSYDQMAIRSCGRNDASSVRVDRKST